MSKSTLFMMVGIPGSGKTHFVNSIASSNATIVSRDEIRFSIINDNDEYFSKEKQVFKEYVNRIQSALDKGGVVYADATQLNGVSRTKLINSLDVSNTNVIPVMVKTSLDKCLKRNAKREGRRRVPDEVIKNMYNSLTDPAEDCKVMGDNYYATILYVGG